MLVQQILGGEVAWEQWPVYVGAELLAGILAALTFAPIAHTTNDKTGLLETLAKQDGETR